MQALPFLGDGVGEEDGGARMRGGWQGWVALGRAWHRVGGGSWHQTLGDTALEPRRVLKTTRDITAKVSTPREVEQLRCQCVHCLGGAI